MNFDYLHIGQNKQNLQVNVFKSRKCKKFEGQFPPKRSYLSTDTNMANIKCQATTQAVFKNDACIRITEAEKNAEEAFPCTYGPSII